MNQEQNSLGFALFTEYGKSISVGKRWGIKFCNRTEQRMRRDERTVNYIYVLSSVCRPGYSSFRGWAIFAL